MKNKLIAGVVATTLFISGIIAVSLGTTGCGTTGSVGSVITDTNTINTVSNYLNAAVAEAVAYGLTQDKTNTTAYAQLTSAAIGEVIGGTDFTPGALDAAIQKLPAKVLQSPAAGVITVAIESLYQIYWASDVNGAVNGDYAAKTYLSAVKTGIDRALAGQAPVVPLSTLKRPAPKLRR